MLYVLYVLYVLYMLNMLYVVYICAVLNGKAMKWQPKKGGLRDCEGWSRVEMNLDFHPCKAGGLVVCASP